MGTSYVRLRRESLPGAHRLADNPGEALLRAEAERWTAENAELRDRYHRLNTLEEEQQDGRGVTRRRFMVGAAATVTALATTQFASTQAVVRRHPGRHADPRVPLRRAGRAGPGLAGHRGRRHAAGRRPARPGPADRRPDRARPRLQAQRGVRPARRRAQGRRSSAFIPAVSDPRLSRSHFQAQDACNLGGLPAETGGVGFLDSLVGLLGDTGTRSAASASARPCPGHWSARTRRSR